jgi:O-antigen/teichoic acid export membrane protein
MTEAPRRSDFVTVLAWISIILSGFFAFMMLFQSILFNSVLKNGDFDRAMSQTQNAQNINEYHQVIMSSMQYVFILIAVFSIFVLITSIALLKRKNWARVTFIVFLTLGIVWNVLGLVLQPLLMPDMTDIQGQEGMAQMNEMMNVMQIGTMIFVVAFTILYAWIIKKLVSKPIKEEFNAILTEPAGEEERS